jgi:hypothetical protein
MPDQKQELIDFAKQSLATIREWDMEDDPTRDEWDTDDD